MVEQWLNLPGIDPDRSFAVRVDGDAMTGPGENCFRRGDVIVLGLDEVVTSGSFALVRTLWKNQQEPHEISRTLFCRYLMTTRKRSDYSSCAPRILPAYFRSQRWNAPGRCSYT